MSISSTFCKNIALGFVLIIYFRFLIGTLHNVLPRTNRNIKSRGVVPELVVTELLEK